MIYRATSVRFLCGDLSILDDHSREGLERHKRGLALLVAKLRRRDMRTEVAGQSPISASEH